MTVSSSNNKNRYEGNGVTDTFAFTGRIFAESDLVVEIITRATDALEETLTIITDYSVTINTDESASVTVVSGKIPSSTQDIQIRRSVAQSQSLNLPVGTRFPATSVENALDRGVVQVQDLSEEVNRKAGYAVTSSTTVAPVFPEPVDDTTILFDGTTGALKVGPTLTELNVVSAIGNDIETVASISANVTAVADDESDIGTVATNIANVNTVAGDITNVNTVAGDIADVNTVAGISSDVTTVAGDATDIGTVATNIANVNTVAGDITNVNTVAGDIADVNTVATNVADVNNFADVYNIASSDPATRADGSALVEGDLYYNTTSDRLRVYDGSVWIAAVDTGSGISDVIDDTTPQLGGNLDVNGNDITSASNGDIVIAPNGTGEIQLDGNLKGDAFQENAIGSIGGGTQDIDLDSGRAVSATVDTSTTTFTFSNPRATGNQDIFTLRLTNGGSQTVNWPASVDWIGGNAPTLTASGVDELVFKTVDGGTTWVGAALIDVK